jgi:hypothetical protein
MDVKYQVVIKDFVDPSTSDFGPGATIAIIENATNIGWAEYINEVGEAFFSMSQEDPKIGLLTDALDLGKHCLIYRNGELVWGGWLGESDENLNDVVFTAYSYVSGFYHYIMQWDTEWTGVDADQIIEDAFDAAQAKTKSRVGWFTKGTIQHLWLESGGPTTLQMPLYRAPYKRILSVFREITAYAISDTDNRAKFVVTPNGTFQLWHDDKSTLNDVRWQIGDGKVRNFSRIRLPVDRRNEIWAVGTSPKNTVMRKGVTKTANRDAAGLKQEPIYMSWIKNATELERIANIRAARAVRVDTDLYLSFFRNTVVPYRASTQDYGIGDNVTISLSRGLTSLEAEVKMIVGQQVIYANGSEYVRVLLNDRLS